MRIDGRKIIGCPEIKFGHNYYGYDVDDVIKPLILCTKDVAVGQNILPNIPAGCIPSLKTEMCGVFFPSCSSDCQERKTCTSSATICGWRTS